MLSPKCANGYYSTCGSNCPITCENYNNPPTFCDFVCRVGCVCNKGYVLSGTQVLLSRIRAPLPVCVNGKYSSCASLCEKTCQNVNSPPMMCAAVCVNGCVCNPGYIKESSNSLRCVAAANCA
ncbi:unnamed protein product [Medioppia subpectinata]|uniref:TIL domain-containing protein n=1 Tax=Medioppia subpectinata TaxID=1979941 RepID=A0A7R9PZT2_9ACAR|nr:unnamed protein product [Medioppia subpectinata]CAG2106793.1 unnamed protein product [Medioppia subpectinata]